MQITYITPIYKSDEFNIRMLYKSLQKQTNPNWIWFIYDDNEDLSQNTARDFICDLIDRNNPIYDNRVIFVEHEYFCEMKGSGPAKYMAFKKAEQFISTRDCEVFCELDHDDLLDKECTETILSLYEQTHFDFLHADTVVLKDDFNPALTYFSKVEPFTHPIFGYQDVGDVVYAEVTIPNIVRKFITMNIRCYNRFFYKSIGGFDYNVAFGEDFDILIKIACSAKKIVYARKILYYYNFNDNCNSSKINCEEVFNQIIEKNKGLINMFQNSQTIIDDNSLDNKGYMLYHNEQIINSNGN